MRNATFHRPINHVVAVAVLGSSNVICAQIPCGYEVSTVISAPGCPDPFCPATHVRDLSEPIDGGLPTLVGEITELGFEDAFWWTSKTGMVLLAMPPGTFTSRANSISPDGRFIVGDYDLSTDSLNDLGFLLDDGKFIEINPPSPPPSGSFSQPVAVNTNRQVAGTTFDPISGFKRAFFWQDSEMTLIEPTFGPRTVGRDINEAGIIVGWMGTAAGISSHAFLWDGEAVIDLGLVPNTFSTRANSVNQPGHVLIRGEFTEEEPSDRIAGSFLWNEDETVDLGTLPGYDIVAGIDLNDRQQVVGLLVSIQDRSLPNLGFFWQDGVMTDLNDLLPPDSDLTIFRAESINNAGQVTGRAADANNDVVTFILTPIEPPVGDLDGDCAVGVKDLLMLLGKWGPCGDCGACPADLDGDCEVGVSDLLILLGNWE